jgi:hypothetical protein
MVKCTLSSFWVNLKIEKKKNSKYRNANKLVETKSL